MENPPPDPGEKVGEQKTRATGRLYSIPQIGSGQGTGGTGKKDTLQQSCVHT